MYLPDERLDSTCTAVDLIEGDFADDLGAVLSIRNIALAESNIRGRRKCYHELPQLLDLLDLGGELFGEDFLQSLRVGWWLAELPMCSRFNGLPGFCLRNSNGSH